MRPLGLRVLRHIALITTSHLAIGTFWLQQATTAEQIQRVMFMAAREFGLIQFNRPKK